MRVTQCGFGSFGDADRANDKDFNVKTKENRLAVPSASECCPRSGGHPPATWREAYERGTQTWPRVAMGYEEFLPHVISLGYGEGLPHHAADLFLTTACWLGFSAAHRVLEHMYVLPLRGAVRRIVRDEFLVDEVLQELRRRLLVGPGKIASYRGQGSLRGWLRAIAVHLATDRLRTEKSRRRRSLEQGREQAASEAPRAIDDSSSLDCKSYATVCAAAVRQALSALESKEKQLLHDYFIAGLSIDLLGPRYVVNRSTVARRIGRITARLRRSVRRHLASAYRAESVRSLESLAAAACGHLDIEMSFLLPATVRDVALQHELV